MDESKLPKIPGWVARASLISYAITLYPHLKKSFDQALEAEVKKEIEAQKKAAFEAKNQPPGP